MKTNTMSMPIGLWYIHLYTQAHAHLGKLITQDVNFVFATFDAFLKLRLTTDLHLYGDVLVSFPTFLHKLYVIEKVLINWFQVFQYFCHTRTMNLAHAKRKSWIVKGKYKMHKIIPKYYGTEPHILIFSAEKSFNLKNLIYFHKTYSYCIIFWEHATKGVWFFLVI